VLGSTGVCVRVCRGGEPIPINELDTRASGEEDTEGMQLPYLFSGSGGMGASSGVSGQAQTAAA